MKTGGGLISRSALCGVALAASTAAACCFLTVWSYWYNELDADCANGRDCKCVLFGTSFAGGAFVGGERSACRYAFCSALASAGLAACNCAYYGLKALLYRPATAGRGGLRRHHHHRPVQRSSDDGHRPDARYIYFDRYYSKYYGGARWIRDDRIELHERPTMKIQGGGQC